MPCQMVFLHYHLLVTRKATTPHLMMALSKKQLGAFYTLFQNVISASALLRRHRGVHTSVQAVLHISAFIPIQLESDLLGCLKNYRGNKDTFLLLFILTFHSSCASRDLGYIFNSSRKGLDEKIMFWEDQYLLSPT